MGSYILHFDYYQRRISAQNENVKGIISIRIASGVNAFNI